MIVPLKSLRDPALLAVAVKNLMKIYFKLFILLPFAVLAGCDDEKSPTADQIKSGLEHLFISSKTSPDSQYDYGMADILSVDIVGNGCEKQRESINWTCDIAIHYANYQGKLVKRLTSMEFYYQGDRVVPSLLDGMQIFNPEDIRDK